MPYHLATSTVKNNPSAGRNISATATRPSYLRLSCALWLLGRLLSKAEQATKLLGYCVPSYAEHEQALG